MFSTILTFSIVGLAFGFLMIAGGAMSDAPAEGDRSAKSGGILFLVSLVALIADIVFHFKGII